MARRILGKIDVQGGRSTGRNLRVMAWDADVDDDDHMGTAMVAEDGSYDIEYKGDSWDWSPVRTVTKWRPDIYVVVEWLDLMSETWKIVGRSKVYSDQDTRQDREINLSVTLPYENTCCIHGSVLDALDRPLGGYTVTAWDEARFAVQAVAESGAESPEGSKEPALYLGSTVTNGEGEYRMQYADSYWETLPGWPQTRDQGSWWRPNIFIKVHNKESPGVLYRSPTIENVINIVGVKIDAKITEK